MTEYQVLNSDTGAIIASYLAAARAHAKAESLNTRYKVRRYFVVVVTSGSGI